MTLLNLILLVLLGGMSYYVTEIIIGIWHDKPYANSIFRTILFSSGAVIGFLGGLESGSVVLAVPCGLAGFFVGFFLGRWHDELMERIRGN